MKTPNYYGMRILMYKNTNRWEPQISSWSNNGLQLSCQAHGKHRYKKLWTLSMVQSPWLLWGLLPLPLLVWCTFYTEKQDTWIFIFSDTDRSKVSRALDNFGVHKGFKMDYLIATTCKDCNTRKTGTKKKKISTTCKDSQWIKNDPVEL